MISGFKLGIIGFSEGNGHPYSWSAIFNGYDKERMNECGFPIIPQYLSEHKFPEESIKEASVTHVWTQSLELSRHIATASYIKNIVSDPEQMIGQVDALLLARDDAKNHLSFSRPFLDAGLPVYIDKPLALTRADAEALFELEKYPGQIFSCSALRFSDELMLSRDDFSQLGELRHIIGRVPNSWGKYIIHAVDPILENIGFQGKIIESKSMVCGDRTILNFCWETGVTCSLLALGASRTRIELEFIGSKGEVRRTFADSFAAFKSALSRFLVDSLVRKVTHKKRIFEAVDIVEKGLC